MDKLYLVREEELKHLRKPTSSPTTSSLDTEITEILNSNLHEYDKVTQYNNILMKHLTMLNKERKPLEFKVIGPKDFHLYLNYLPKNIQKSAEIILDMISKNPKTLDINEKSEIIFHDHLIPSSNIIDLLKKVLIKSPTTNIPNGLSEFQDALNELNIPKSILNPIKKLVVTKPKKTIAPFRNVKKVAASKADKRSPIFTRSLKQTSQVTTPHARKMTKESSDPNRSLKRTSQVATPYARKRKKTKDSPDPIEWITY